MQCDELKKLYAEVNVLAKMDDSDLKINAIEENYDGVGNILELLRNTFDSCRNSAINSFTTSGKYCTCDATFIRHYDLIESFFILCVWNLTYNFREEVVCGTTD